MKKLTGLEIFKYLPAGKKTQDANCKKCGFPTCMAFAMKLSKGETQSDKCNYLPDELKEILEDSLRKPQEEVTFGPKNNEYIVGGEIVLFRHDKKFVNPTCIAVKLCSTDKDFSKKLSQIASYCVERVGENLKISAVALYDEEKGSNKTEFIKKAKQICAVDLPLILVSSDKNLIETSLQELKNYKPLVYLKKATQSDLLSLQKDFDGPVVVSSDNLSSLMQTAGELLEKGLTDFVLNLNSVKSSELIENMTFIRRFAVENKFRPAGFPVITFLDEIKLKNDDIIDKTLIIGSLILKYSNAIVVDFFNEASIYSLLTLRQNIFIDPEKPLQIDAKIYPIGEPDKNSPVIVTTNFALTYFTVVSEIESSGIPAYLLITSSDGMSVLTAWAADKFTGEIVKKAVDEYNIRDLVNHRKLIIPGYAYSLKTEIEEELPDWEVITGPNEAVDLPDFLNKYVKACV
jgi:acetyl-CoA decarbonylase/synthase, CODH/ACS complex subunit gamma